LRAKVRVKGQGEGEGDEVVRTRASGEDEW